MKIDHVTFAPTGGAGLVANLLMKAQKELGLDTGVLTLSPSGLRQSPLSNLGLTGRAALDELIIKNPKSSGMISVARRDYVSNLHAAFRASSLVHLHWVEGVINHQQIAELLSMGRKIVWTLHDSAPFTGGCHSPMGCKKFTHSCTECPQVRPKFVSLVSKSHSRISKVRFDQQGLRLVAPTNALAKQALTSSVFKDLQVKVVGNPISNTFFREPDRASARRRLGLSEGDFVGVAISEQLDNPLKQIPQLLKVFSQVAVGSKEKAVLILIGRNGKRIAEKHLNCIWVGQMSDHQMAETVPAADLLISASLSESAGMTVIEAGALGVPAISIRNGGSDELIENGLDGILVNNLNELGRALRAVSGDRSRLRDMGKRASVRAAASRPDLVSAKYLEIYNQLLEGEGGLD